MFVIQVPLNRIFTCDCTGFASEGDNCEIDTSVTILAAQFSGENEGKLTALYAVIGVVAAVALIVIVYVTPCWHAVLL